MIRSLTWLWAGNVGSLFFGLASSMLVARLLSTDNMGRMGLLLAVCTFFSSIFLAWAQVPLIRYGKAVFENTGSWYAAWVKRLPILLVSFLVAFVLLLPPIAKLWSAYIDMVWQWSVFGLVISGVIMLWAQAEVVTLAQIQERFDVIGRMSVYKQALSAVAFTVIFLSGTMLNAGNALLVTIISGLAAALFSFKAIARIDNVSLQNNSQETGNASTWAMTKHGMPVIVTMLASYLSYYGDHWLINVRLTIGDVGQFVIAYQVYLLIVGLTSPFCSVLLPRLIAEEIKGAEKSAKYIRKLFPSAHILWLIFILMVSAVIPEIYPLVYSSRYEQGLVPLIVLLSGTVFCLLSSTYSPFYNVQSRLSKSTLFNIILTAINLAISWFLLPVIGILGSAVGTAVARIVAGMLYVTDQQRQHNVREYGQIVTAVVAVPLVLLNVLLLEHQFARYGVSIIEILLMIAIARRFRYFDYIDFQRCFIRYPDCGRWLKLLLISERA